MTAIFLLGKTGDIINSLGFARLSVRECPDWYVHTKYATVLSGVSYVRPIRVHYQLHDLKRCLDMHAKEYGRVLMPQTFGKTWGGRRDLPHNLVAWLNCGFTEAQFGDLVNFPLVFDRRDAERENFLYRRHVKSKKPMILLAVGCARSATFPSYHVFTEAIRRKWGDYCNILNLCEVKAARIYDLLGLMERARLLITADSSPMHLAAAVPTLPVIVLSAGHPYLSARPRCRVAGNFVYGAVVREMGKVHDAVAAALRA